MCKIKRKGKLVITAVLALLILVGLFAGCVVADRNTRRIGFGETAPVVSRYRGEGERRGLSFYVLGNRYVLDVTPAFEAAQAMAKEVDAVLRAASDVGNAWLEQIEPKGW